jgi:hypothetical protein
MVKNDRRWSNNNVVLSNLLHLELLSPILGTLIIIATLGTITSILTSFLPPKTSHSLEQGQIPMG